MRALGVFVLGVVAGSGLTLAVVSCSLEANAHLDEPVELAPVTTVPLVGMSATWVTRPQNSTPRIVATRPPSV